MGAKVTTTQTTEVKLTPALKTKLKAKLKIFTANKAQIQAYEHANRKIREEVEKLFVDAGEFGALQEGVKIDDCSLKHISPIKTRLDPKKLVAQGVTTAQIEAATTTTPGTSYMRITVPGDKEDE